MLFHKKKIIKNGQELPVYEASNSPMDSKEGELHAERRGKLEDMWAMSLLIG